jgi:hypothetical protein
MTVATTSFPILENTGSTFCVKRISSSLSDPNIVIKNEKGKKEEEYATDSILFS